MAKQNNKDIKIVGIGACVMDTLITVPTFPKEDTKMRAEATKVVGGGPTATGLVAAQKLGERAAYIGALSDDNGGVFLRGDFEKYGVCTDYIKVESGYRSFASTIWLAKDTATRTCVFDRGNVPMLQLNESQKQVIIDSDILMVDGNSMDTAVEGCKIARANKTKVLYDCGGLYEGVERLLELTDVMIPSEEFALGHTGCTQVSDAAKHLYEKYHPEVVVITCGKEGGIIYDGDTCVSYPAFLVEAVDTNGSGDVFHGAFAAAMVKGYSYRGCCLFASTTSAIKCTGIGARESVPSEKEVLTFLKDRGVEL